MNIAKKKTVRLTADVCLKLEEIAEGRRSNASDIIRIAIDEFLSSQEVPESAYQIASRIGLVGGAKFKLPSDLSTNRKHFSGFGK